MKLAGLFIYPVKSCRGIAVDTAGFDEFGLRHDRRFLVVDAAGRFLTQRSRPAMARIATALTATELVLSLDGAGSFAVPLAPREVRTLARRSVGIWRDTVEADDCGDEPARRLTDWLGEPARLVQVGAAYRRPVRKSPGDAVAFNDAWPLLVVSESSLAGLNARLSGPVPMDRFRPNLVVAGAAAPHAEDAWRRLRIGADVVLRAGGPCARCVVTATDQLTGERGDEPLRTLASYRRRPEDPGSIDFGQNFVHETKAGTIRTGDPVTPLE